MKRLAVLLAVAGLCAHGAFAELLEATAEAERALARRYTTGRARRLAEGRLDAILSDARLSDAEKEARIRAAFLAARALTPENAGELLLYTPPLSWRVHSLAVAYDLDGRWQSIVSRERLAEAKATRTRGANAERTQTSGRTSTGEMSGTLRAEAGLVFGFIPKLSADADAKASKTTASTSAAGNAAAWTRQDQAALSARFESVMRELGETKLSGLHVRFAVEFANRAGRDLVVPAGSLVPVYAGGELSVMAKMESDVDLNVPSGGAVTVPFRGDLSTTAARGLVDFMRTATPTVALERSPLLRIRSADGAIADAVNESRRVASASVVCGAYTWNVRKTWDGRPVTMLQALAAVNAGYDAPPFAWEGTRLKSVCGVACAAFDLGRIPCVEADGRVSIGWDDLSRPLAADALRLGVMKVGDVFDGRGGRWGDLTPESQVALVARLRELEDTAEAQFYLGNCYAEGQGVPQSWAEAARWFRKSAEQGNAEAQCGLGVCYAEGNGVGQSRTEAVRWFRKAAEQGDAEAQAVLGGCYAKGDGVGQSWTEAVRWVHKAAEQGNAEAQAALGWCYRNGQGVAQSNAEAARWYRRAAQNGFKLSDGDRTFANEN